MTTSSGEETLALLGLRQDFALILLDVLMPGMDGFEVASMLKRIEGTRHIPIIFVTAIAGAFLGESIGWRRWAAVAVGFLGVIVCLRPGAAAPERHRIRPCLRQVPRFRTQRREEDSGTAGHKSETTFGWAAAPAGREGGDGVEHAPVRDQ